MQWPPGGSETDFWRVWDPPSPTFAELRRKLDRPEARPLVAAPIAVAPKINWRPRCAPRAAMSPPMRPRIPVKTEFLISDSAKVGEGRRRLAKVGEGSVKSLVRSQIFFVFQRFISCLSTLPIAPSIGEGLAGPLH